MRSVERALQVLSTLSERPSGFSLVDLARVTGIPMTTLHRLLGVLRSASLVAETATGLHTVGVGSVVLARAFLDGVDLRDIAKPEMAAVVEATGETCHLGVLASVHVVYLEKIDSPHPVRMHSTVGGTNPAVSTAIGRAILAHSSQAVLREVLEGSERLFGMPFDEQDIDAVLDDVRSSGYSTDLQDNELGICCVGAPVFDHTGRVIAGLSLSTPSSRFDSSRLDQVGALVAAAGERVSRALGWSGTQAEVG
ncbi:IclR family transcriptional regulator [Terrabacter terrigena]|uniref:IclR family transcriptional regulator n=2 Tax=Terrabacter terrigena TaxID=574718 RepID=A0ABW3N109_9MICO